ncbi:hypothetical protein QWJ46_00620 [Rhizobium sp. CBN3]|uniref:hypothetical protein n=1 Tax=Rhizobium sp. CBN3 TaxID=3058045 RepID=UPI002673A5CB|nr:hypothetical protein [Rhizobium sp. CBN3]MDO3431177.1 hypothetical protein [Rhizobium sp. CBN3]
MSFASVLMDGPFRGAGRTLTEAHPEGAAWAIRAHFSNSKVEGMNHGKAEDAEGEGRGDRAGYGSPKEI